jgi:segregation and condensation protein A
MPLEPIPIEVEPQPFQLQLEVFAGPLDLLLQLIESRQLDVLTVPLAAMADAYVEHLANHPVPADELADFVAIASQLILLKSRRLLPGDALPAGLVAEEEPDEDELRRRLVEYRALRDASRLLGEWDMARPAYRREPREADLPEAAVEPMPPLLLSEALERLAAIPEPAPAPPEVMLREVTIAMQIATLRGAMGRAGQVVLQRVLAGCQSRTEIAVTVLAMLELVRRRQATVQQDELFGPIVLRPIGTGNA